MVKATKKTHYLTQDIEPSTWTSQPKAVKICDPQYCSKCGKKIRRPKVQKPKKKKKTPPSMPKRKTCKKTAPPKKRTNKGKGKELFGHYRRLLKELSAGTGKEPEYSSTENARISISD